jgi:hypothetical protein
MSRRFEMVSSRHPDMAERSLKVARSVYAPKVDPQPHDCLGNLRADTYQHNLRAKQPRSLHDRQQPLGDLAIDDWDAGDVEHQITRR